MNSRKVRILLIIFVILNIVAMIAIINLTNQKNKEIEERIARQNNVQVEIEKTSDGKKVEGFKNPEVLYRNYRGYIPKTEITEKIKIIVDQYFPILYKDVVESSVNTEEYFNKYKASIKNRFGITDFETFSKLVGEVGKINCDISDYISYELIEDSFVTDGEYTKATLVYTYSNGQSINLDIYMLNEESDTEVEYKIIPRG